MNYRYTTITALRNEGVELDVLSDAKADTLIRMCSDFIDTLTDQWFAPMPKVVRLEGKDSDIIYHPSRIPIVKLNSFNRVYADGTLINIPLQYLFVDERWIEIEASTEVVTHIGYRIIDKFERRHRFLAVAVWGWLDNAKDVSADLTLDLVTGGDTATFSGLSGGYFEVGDQIVIVGSGQTITTMANAVTSTTIKLDKLSLPATIAAGAKIYSYGRTPLAIQNACKQLVIFNTPALASEEFQQQALETRLIMERTDNYEYKLDSTTDGRRKGVISITGNDQIDNLLAHYVAPPFVGFA